MWSLHNELIIILKKIKAIDNLGKIQNTYILIKYPEDKLEQFIDYSPKEKKIKDHLGVNYIEVRRNFFLITTS